jgi:[ribosomal protein S5]-alanine N-acetyltransferase
VPDLQLLRADHAPAVFAFELTNRAYFSTFISDRGDEFFDHFDDSFEELLAEQEAGTCILHVLVDESGDVLGRFNLVHLEDGKAELGYRMAQHAAGRGVATATVRELCQRARDHYGVRTLRAATSFENVPSQRVLVKAGFVLDGPAEPGGRPGSWYRRDLGV